MSTMDINGKTFYGNSIRVENGKMMIDGKIVDIGAHESIVELRIIEGVVKDIDADCSVSALNVTGNIDAGGSVTCDNVGGDVDAGGSVSCEDVGGDVDAGGSVNCETIKGKLNAGGSVRMGR